MHLNLCSIEAEFTWIISCEGSCTNTSVKQNVYADVVVINYSSPSNNKEYLILCSWYQNQCCFSQIIQPIPILSKKDMVSEEWVDTSNFSRKIWYRSISPIVSYYLQTCILTSTHHQWLHCARQVTIGFLIFLHTYTNE